MFYIITPVSRCPSETILPCRSGGAQETFLIIILYYQYSKQLCCLIVLWKQIHFSRILWRVESSKNSIYMKSSATLQMFYCHCYQFIVFFLNKSIFFFTNKILLILNFWTVVYMKGQHNWQISQQICCNMHVYLIMTSPWHWCNAAYYSNRQWRLTEQHRVITDASHLVFSLSVSWTPHQSQSWAHSWPRHPHAPLSSTEAQTYA